MPARTALAPAGASVHTRPHVQWVSHASGAASFVDAIAESIAGVQARLDGSRPDVVFAFVTPHHREHYDEIVPACRDAFGGAVVFGSTAGGVIGGGRELERVPAVSITGAVLPGVEVSTFHLDADEGPWPADAEGWHARLDLAPDPAPNILLLSDPFTIDITQTLAQLDRSYPGSVKIGGVTSGAAQAGHGAMFCGETTHANGLCGLALTGNLVVDTLVAQGCRPVGTPLFVTRAEANVIHELDGRPAARVLQELYEQASGRDRELMRSSLFIGLVTRGDQQVYRHGDFLVRNVLGLDGSSGALAIGAVAPRNGVVQFHVRDAASSAHDLTEVLAGYADRRLRPAGGLMFSCVGRGIGLYHQPNHDLDEVREHLGEVQIGGCFCGGEIGPVGGRTFLHGYTSAFALFRRALAD